MKQIVVDNLQVYKVFFVFFCAQSHQYCNSKVLEPSSFTTVVTLCSRDLVAEEKQMCVAHNDLFLELYKTNHVLA